MALLRWLLSALWSSFGGKASTPRSYLWTGFELCIVFRYTRLFGGGYTPSSLRTGRLGHSGAPVYLFRYVPRALPEGPLSTRIGVELATFGRAHGAPAAAGAEPLASSPRHDGLTLVALSPGLTRVAVTARSFMRIPRQPLLGIKVSERSRRTSRSRVLQSGFLARQALSPHLG